MACPTSAGAATQRGRAGLVTALQLSRNVTFCLSAGERFASTLTAFSRCPRFWHEVEITQERFGPLHLAMGRPLNSKERWIVISDEPTSLETFREYGLRFDIEENFLDDKSNGFQLEASLIRSAPALERLCLVLAVATLSWVSQGTHIVETGQRRRVDAHWFRGSSYLKIGWNWIRRAVSRKEKLLTHVGLSPSPDPEPAMASRKQHDERTKPRFYGEVRHAA